MDGLRAGRNQEGPGAPVPVGAPLGAAGRPRLPGGIPGRAARRGRPRCAAGRHLTGRRVEPSEG